MDLTELCDTYGPETGRLLANRSMLRCSFSGTHGPTVTEHLAGIRAALALEPADTGSLIVTLRGLTGAWDDDHLHSPRALTDDEQIAYHWITLVTSAHFQTPVSSVLEMARTLGDRADDQWNDIAELFGIDDDHRGLWVALAPDWEGTGDELADAVRAAQIDRSG